MATLANGDTLTAFSFEFSIDGQAIPNVVEVNGLTQNTEVIETRSMTADGRYVRQHLVGPQQSGKMTLRVLNTGAPSVTQWLMDGIKGNLQSARKTGKLVYRDTMGNPILTQEFQNVVVHSIDYGSVKAGGAEALHMNIALSFTEMTTS